MTVLAKKVFTSSKPVIVRLLCPPPRGSFSIQESAVGGLSYKVKYYEGFFTLIYYIHLSFVFQVFLLYLQNFTQIFTNTKEVRFTSFIERPND